MSVLSDDQMNSVINCLTAKSTWDDLILYHEGPFDVKESRDFQDSHDDEEDTRISQEYMNDLEEEYQPKKGLLAETYDWDEDEVSSDDNEVTKVKALMALTDEERVSVSKESAKNSEWIKISMKKVHTPLEMEDNDDRISYLDYLCIDLNYVEEQRNNRMSKHINLVQELNTCKEQLLVLKQAKLDLLTMQHVNTEILKENQNLRNELKELTSITEAWLNSSNKVNQPKDPVFVKSLADNSEVSITDSNKPKLSRAEDSILSNHDTGKHPLPPLEKLTGAEPVFEPKTIKSILKSKSTFKTKTLKGITINEPFSAPARGNKSSSASKTNSALAGKIISLRSRIKPRNPQNIIKNYETCGSNVHTTSDHNDIEWFRKREALQAKKVESFKASMIDNTLFIYKTQTNVILVQIHVDNILESASIEQSERSISINKERYGNDLLRKYEKIGSLVNTPSMPLNMLGPDLNGKAINKFQYKAMFSNDAEDVAAARCCANILWIKSHLTD
ncbi:hypothetical protein Tco_0879073 [Tanacetum coccineum]